MEDWRKYVNTILLSIITGAVTLGGIMLNTSFDNLNTKLDSTLILGALNAERINSHNIEASIWKDRINEHSTKIDALESGQHSSTMDRITKAEVMEAMEIQRDWVEKYFARK